MPTPMPDEALVRLLQQSGLITNEQLAQARSVQTTPRNAGTPLPLGAACVQLGILTQDQYRNFEVRYQKEYGGATERLGQYRLIKKIGEGGMGSVYLAEDTMLGRQVAIKVLPESVAADAVLLGRFKREAIAAGKLNHANVATAFSFGSAGSRNFYVMEYCPGESLEESIRQLGRLPEKEAVQLAIQVAKGLQYAHDHGIIHRDVKPANVVLMPDGVAKILDLGLSKNLADTSKSSQTMSGITVGTPDYISPEQARGVREIDGRVDIYALGGTLYYLVTGRAPFDGNTAAVVMLKHLTDPLPDPRLLNRHLSEGLVQVLMKAMAKEPDDRYQNMSQMIEDLQSVLSGGKPAHAASANNSASAPLTQPASRRHTGSHAALIPPTARSGRTTGLQPLVSSPGLRRLGRARRTELAASDRRSKAVLIVTIILLSLLALGLGIAWAPQTLPAVANTNQTPTPRPETAKTAPLPVVPPPAPQPPPNPSVKSELLVPVKKESPEHPVSKTATAQEPHWPVQLLAKNRYYIHTEGERTMRVPLQTPGFTQADCEMAIGVTDAADDTGDKGMYFKLLNANGEELLNQFSNCGSNPTVWFKVRVKPNAKYTLIMEDLDTVLTGPYPGNHFSVEVLLKP